MRIVLMGPPGAGKGTQAKRLSESFSMLHLSSGDILRAEKASGSALGKQLAEYMNAGKLVPDATVVEVMAKAVAAATAGLLLDGFPRTVPQAEALDGQLKKAGKPLDAVVVITARNEEIVKRITGRRTCPKCGYAFHVEYLKPKVDGVCDACGGSLVQRDDDKEAVVRQRLDAYYKQTEPVIAYYRGLAGMKVIEVDGSRSPQEVTEAMKQALKSLGAA